MSFNSPQPTCPPIGPMGPDGEGCSQPDGPGLCPSWPPALSPLLAVEVSRSLPPPPRDDFRGLISTRSEFWEQEGAGLRAHCVLSSCLPLAGALRPVGASVPSPEQGDCPVVTVRMAQVDAPGRPSSAHR